MKIERRSASSSDASPSSRFPLSRDLDRDRRDQDDDLDGAVETQERPSMRLPAPTPPPRRSTAMPAAPNTEKDVLDVLGSASLKEDEEHEEDIATAFAPLKSAPPPSTAALESQDIIEDPDPTTVHHLIRPTKEEQTQSRSISTMPPGVRARMPSRPPLPSEAFAPLPSSSSRPRSQKPPHLFPAAPRKPTPSHFSISSAALFAPAAAPTRPEPVSSGRGPRPSQYPTVRPPPPPLPIHDTLAFDATEAAPVSSTKSSHSVSALRIDFPAPQFSAPRSPQPFGVPRAPITRPILESGGEERHESRDESDARIFDPSPTSRRAVTAPTLSEYAHALPPPPFAAFGQQHYLPQQNPNETPSVAPVSMSMSTSTALPILFAGSRADLTTQLRPHRDHARLLVAAAATLVAIALLGVIVLVVAVVPKSSLAHAKSKTPNANGANGATANDATASEPPPPSTVIVAPTTTYVPQPPVVMPSSTTSTSTSPLTVPPVSADVPSQNIEPDQTLVTFPSSAKGHRVFVDGHPIEGSDPTLIKCGKHKLQVGSLGKLQVVTLPCGGTYTLE